MIEEVNDFDFLYDIPDDVNNILFDVEETILKKNEFYTSLSNQRLKNIFLSMCDDVKISEVMYYGKNFKRYLTDKELPDIIKFLKSKNKRIFALTTGYPSALKRKRLYELKIFFDEILYAYGQPKGPVLVSYLSRNKIDGNFYFIDNHREKIINVDTYFNSYYQNIENAPKLFCYLYKFQPKDIHITTENFKNYWEKVITFVKKKTYNLKRNNNRNNGNKTEYKMINDLIVEAE
jgi:hypothetical protein